MLQFAMDSNNDFFSWLERRLKAPIPGFDAHRKMMHLGRQYLPSVPASCLQSAVLMLLYPSGGHYSTVLIERSADGHAHSGQMAFPGGRKEEEDDSLVDTALREANEEVNLDIGRVRPIGHLSSLYIPVSNFQVHPIVAVSWEPPSLARCEVEVADIVHCPIPGLFSHEGIVEIGKTSYHQSIRTPAYLLSDDRIIWGATAMILSELKDLWDEWTGDGD